MNIAFIPVRGGSKSIPLKNIKILNGKPLVYWTAKAANDSKHIDKVIIATDSLEIKNTVLSFGLEKVEVYDRDPQNAQDKSSTESVMLEYINKSNLNPDDKFVLIQATSPLLESTHIDSMFDKLNLTGADSIFSGVREHKFYWKNIEESDFMAPINYDYTNRPRRQDWDGMILENGACYINSVENIIKDKNRLSGKITYYELPPETAFEIDEESDWIIIEQFMKN